MSTTTTGNPLKKYYRAPKLYITLPSGGKFNKVSDEAMNGELPVFAMTSRDELLLRNPDALLNGDAIVQAIQSCVPAIKDPKQLPVCDIDLILIAIRQATYGEIMEAKLKSPHSGKTDSYDVNFSAIIDNVETLPDETHVTLNSGCTVYVRPFSYTIQTRLNLLAFDQAKTIRDVGEVSDKSAQQFKAMFLKLANTNMDVIAESVVKITTPEGDEISDLNMIKEFIENLESVDSKKIDKRIDELNKAVVNTKQEFACTETGKTFEAEVKLDPADFFVNS